MAHITTCTRCGACYEESSEETANAPVRHCPKCHRETDTKPEKPLKRTSVRIRH